MDFIVTETNHYASFCMGDDKYQKMEKISLDDMHAYFGIMIIMGLTKLPALGDYWRRDPLFALLLTVCPETVFSKSTATYILSIIVPSQHHLLTVYVRSDNS